MVSAALVLSICRCVRHVSSKPNGSRTPAGPRVDRPGRRELLISYGPLPPFLLLPIAKVTLQITRPRKIALPRIPSATSNVLGEQTRNRQGKALYKYPPFAWKFARLECESIKLRVYILFSSSPSYRRLRYPSARSLFTQGGKLIEKIRKYMFPIPCYNLFRNSSSRFSCIFSYTTADHYGKTLAMCLRARDIFHRIFTEKFFFNHKAKFVKPAELFVSLTKFVDEATDLSGLANFFCRPLSN